MAGKQITIAGIVLLCAIIISSIIYLHKNQQFDNNNPALAIPTGSAFLLQVNKPEAFKKALFSNIEFKGELAKFEHYQYVIELLSHIDSSAFFASPIAAKVLARPYIISFLNDSDTSRQWLYSSTLQSRSEISEWNKELEKLKSSTSTVKSSEGKTFHIRKKDGWPLDAYIAQYNGNLILSPSPSVIELSISALRRKQSLAHLPDFRQLQKQSSPSGQAILFVNYANLAKYSKDALKLPMLPKFAAWTELDVDIRKDAVYLNGFTLGKEDSFAAIFKGIEPQKSEIASILPASTRFMVSYSLASSSHFKDRLNAYISSSDSTDAINSLKLKFETRHKEQFDELFFSIIDGEGAFVYAAETAADSYQPLLLFSTTGQTQALETMQKLMKNNRQSTEPAQWVQLDDQTRFPVYRTPETTIIKEYWGCLFPEVPAKYFSFYRNYIIFADEISAINQVVYANILNKTLASHPYFVSFAENFSYRENFFVFCEIGHIFKLSKDRLNKAVFNPTNEQNNALNNFYGIGVQLSSTSDLIYTSVYANYTPHRDKEPRTIWQSRLDSTIVGKPALVDNHNTGDKEIMVQDNKNNLYLINSMGRVLWKRPLDGIILSEIFQIDYYKNNKFQYLFNTEDKIYILDRNGNHVARYPLSLPSKAANGLNIFDYDNDKEYRIFIALDDKKIHLFDKTGNINPGWVYPQYEGKVTRPVQHFTTQGRDYIVFSDEYRNYILDRRGEIRVKPSTAFIRNDNSQFYLQGRNTDKPLLLTSTKDGELASIELPSGKTTIAKLMDAPSPHHFVLINENSPNPEYLLTSEKEMILFDKNRNEIMKVSFDNGIFPMADIYSFSASDTKFGVVEKSGGKIHLINKDGSSYQGFPLKAISRFSIGFLKSSAYRFNLITGGEYNYLYNYRVE